MYDNFRHILLYLSSSNTKNEGRMFSNYPENIDQQNYSQICTILSSRYSFIIHLIR